MRKFKVARDMLLRSFCSFAARRHDVVSFVNLTMMMMMIAVHSSWSWRIIFMPFVLPSPVSRELRRKYKFRNWNPSCKKNRTHCVHVTLCAARVRGGIMFTSYFTELLSPARFVLLFSVSTWMEAGKMRNDGVVLWKIAAHEEPTRIMS